MIGLFDSGLGGLTVIRRIRELLPRHDQLFLSDQAHVPYGDRTPDELIRLAHQNLRWLERQGVSAIVMACNTSCAVAGSRGYPPITIPILDLIESAGIAVRDAGFRKIGVVATAATVRSGAYGRKIRALAPEAAVTEVAAPALVPLIEAGKVDGDEPRQAVADVCAELPGDLDAVVLACSHYPILDEHFAAALGTGVARIDPAIEQAGRAAALVAARGIVPAQGCIRCVTTGPLEAFRASVTSIMAHAAECEAIAAM